jgi:hypothetical protein
MQGQSPAYNTGFQQRGNQRDNLLYLTDNPFQSSTATVGADTQYDVEATDDYNGAESYRSPYPQQDIRPDSYQGNPQRRGRENPWKP